MEQGPSMIISTTTTTAATTRLCWGLRLEAEGPASQQAAQQDDTARP